MRSRSSAVPLLALSAEVFAHPERHDHPKREATKALTGRATGKCASAIEARKEKMVAKRAARLLQRRIAEGQVSRADTAARNELKYTTIQNDTCVLDPDTVWGPYGVDGEMVRHDLRELSAGQEGIDLYLDSGVIDVETCDPLPNAALTVWNCNSTGYYSSYTGIDPDTHIGQVFFEEDVINQVYQNAPYAAHLDTLTRVTNDEDSVYATAFEDGYSAMVSVEWLAWHQHYRRSGRITLGVNSTAAGLVTSGGSVNVVGTIPTVSVASTKLAQATAVDRADGYTS